MLHRTAIGFARRHSSIAVLLILLVTVWACNPPSEQLAATPLPETSTPKATIAATQAVTEAPPSPKPQPTERVTEKPAARETPSPTAKPAATEEPTPTLAPTAQPSPKPTQPPTPSPVPVLSISDIVELVKKSIVRIKTDLGTGSGVIVSADGRILTAAHVMEGAKDIKIVLPDDKEIAGKALGRDEIRDVGLIQVAANNLTIANFGKSEELRVGDDIMAIGFPLDIKGSATVTRGIVSAFRKDADSGVTSIQTDASINFGNSGGALVNRKGELVGIVVSKMVGSGREGIAWATALSDVSPVMSRLIAGDFIEAPFAKAEATKKFASATYMYSFSYPESWKISDVKKEDQLEIFGPGAIIYVNLSISGRIWDLGSSVKEWVESISKKESDFKLISKDVVPHGLNGIEMVYDRMISNRLTRVTHFFAQATGGGRGSGAQYNIRGHIELTSLKKQKANIDGFFSTLGVSP